MSPIDLHVHTTASDGSYTPSEVVRLAREQGLSAIAITDHDTVLGCAEAMAAGAALGLEVVPGIELSTRTVTVVHILGYYLDTGSPSLAAACDWIVQERDERNRSIAALMAADGLPVSYEAMKARFGSVVGRPHFAQLLVELGLAASVTDGFVRYLNRGRPYYMPRRMLSLERSIQTIVRAGGVPVLAHPFQYRLNDGPLRELIEQCLYFGLRGIECWYSGYSPEQSVCLSALAEEYGLLRTGGSDFHGLPKPQIRLGRGSGELSVPYACLEALREAARSAPVSPAERG